MLPTTEDLEFAAEWEFGFELRFGFEECNCGT
jgi:hypothetical protein